MTTNVVRISENADVKEAAQKLLGSKIHRLLVVDKSDKPLGIVSTTDIIREMRGARWVWSLG
jgi:CBS domain-containing protein